MWFLFRKCEPPSFGGIAGLLVGGKYREQGCEGVDHWTTERSLPPAPLSSTA